MNASVPQKLVLQILVPNAMVTRGRSCTRQLGHEGGVWVNGISALVKGTLLPPEGSARRGRLQPRGRRSPELDYIGALISDFQPPEMTEISLCCS